MMNAKFQAKERTLDPSLQLRPAQWSDLEAVVQLILDVCIADGDPTVAIAPEDLAREWNSPGWDLDKNAWVVQTVNGRLVGYEEFNNRYASASLRGDGYVHPEYHERGIGTAMLRVLEARAREELKLADPSLRVFIRNGVDAGDRIGCELHENEGYKAIRFSWHMEIKLEQSPSAPVWPAGIELRPFVLEDHDHAVFEAHEDAFSDHWGHTAGSFENWQHHMKDRDASLWYIAWDKPSGQIAGYSLCRYRRGNGWVGTLGVRRPWRRRGLGEALLLHSFGEFYQRGTKTVGLGVDAQNPTGATRLYQKAGMYVASEAVLYEKELRPGREPEE